MDELKEKLKLAECPSNWGLAEVKDRKPATFVIERLLEKEEEISEPWVHLCINLTLAYLHSETGDITKAITVLKECDGLLSSSTADLLVKYRPAIDSVSNASRASILMLSSTPSEVKMFLDKIVQKEDLDVPNQAALYAIKANVFLEFGVSGTTIALNHAKEALRKNAKEADWHFLMGKLLSRMRHFTQDHEISPAEISHLQTAFNMSGTPRSAIFLANAYIEKSRSLNASAYKSGTRPDIRIKNQVRQLSAEAKNLIKIALDKNENQCPHILTRCAFAYSKLPPYDRECDTAKQLVEESLKRSPCNPMANKLAGDLCLLDDKPMYHKALKHYEIAASRNVFSANFSAFDIKVKLCMNNNVEQFYSKILEEFTESNYQMLAFIHATEYYLFIRRDLCAAVNYFMKAIELNPNFHALTDRWVKYIQKNVNLYEVISNEVRYSIENQMFHDINQLNLLKNTIKKISEINPKLMEVPIVPNKVQIYIDTHEQESKNVSGRGRGRGRGRGYGRGGGSRGGRGRGRGGESQSERTFENTGAGFKNYAGRGGGFGPRNRSSSRNRIGQNINVNEGLRSDKSKSNFDQSQFNRLSYAHDKNNEVIENPYYVKFLELKYKKMTEFESFKDWLQQYEEKPSDARSDKASKKEKSEKNVSAKLKKTGNSDANLQQQGNSESFKFQELIHAINQLKEEINEIKLSESRSCCSSAHYRREQCHSLKSLEYNGFDKTRKPREYYSDKNESYRRKHGADYLSHERYMDSRDKYYSRNRVEDKYRWRSEDRNSKYNRILPPHREKDKYRGYYRSPEREIRRSPSYTSDSNSDSGSRYHSSHDQRTERRSRRSSFLDRRMDRDSPRHRSPSYSDSKRHTSSRGHMSENRRVKNEYLQHLNNSSSSSSETDSPTHQNTREEKYRRRDRVDSEYLQHRRNSASENEKIGKHSKNWERENKKHRRRLNEEKLKKEVPLPSSSRSSSDEGGLIKKDDNDKNSDTEPCLGFGKVKYPDGVKIGTMHGSNVEFVACSSTDSDEIKKSHPKSKDKAKKNLGYERCLEESSERGHKNKNREVYSEHLSDKYSLQGSHKYQSAGSKDNKKYIENSETTSKMGTKRNTSKASNMGRTSPFKEHRSDEAARSMRKSRDSDRSYKEHARDEDVKMMRKSQESEKSEIYSRKSLNVKDTSTKRASSSHKGASVSRSSSDWENINYQEGLIARSVKHTSQLGLSGDEYDKTSSG